MSDGYARLLPRTVEQYDAAVRWSLLLLALLGAFHLSTFERFVDARQAMQSARAQLAQHRRDSAQVRAARAELSEVLAQVEQAMAREIESRFGTLRDNFALLNADVAVVWCRAQRPETFGDCAGSGLAGAGERSSVAADVRQLAPGQPNLQMEVAPANVALSPGLDSDGAAGPWAAQLLPAELAAAVAALGQRDETLVDLLEPFIERELVEPLFAGLNRSWRSGPNERIAAAVEHNVERLVRIASRPGAVPESADEAIAVMLALKTAAAKIIFEPPPQPRWWLTHAAKDAASTDLLQALDDAVGKGTALAALAAMRARLEGAAAAGQQVLGDLAGAIAELEKTFAAQTEQLGKLLEPLRALSIDLAWFCRNFTLILAFAGAAAIVWPAEKLRLVQLTAGLAAQAGQDLSVWHWFEARRGGTSGSVRRARPYLLALLLLGWTLYVAYRLSGMTGEIEVVGREAAAAVVVLLAAVAWRVHAVGAGPRIGSPQAVSSE